MNIYEITFIYLHYFIILHCEYLITEIKMLHAILTSACHERAKPRQYHALRATPPPMQRMH
jgi:hypothetical protein